MNADVVSYGTKVAGTDLLTRLTPKQRRGSKPRCHLLTHGPREAVAARLTALVSPWGTVRPSDRWMPRGFDDLTEAQLHVCSELLPAEICRELETWWLETRATTPNWDIASTCAIAGEDGLVLIEAKAHDAELINEEVGKRYDADRVSDGSRRNHERIALAIQDANLALNLVHPGWSLTHESRYQMANRFAWAWKIAALRRPVILVYLGFTNALEMVDHGNVLRSAAHWTDLVMTHGGVPPTIWENRWDVNGSAMIPLIRSMELSLP